MVEESGVLIRISYGRVGTHHSSGHEPRVGMHHSSGHEPPPRPPRPPAALTHTLPNAGRHTHLVLPEADRLDDDGVIPGHLAEEHDFVGVPRYAAQHSSRRAAANEGAAAGNKHGVRNRRCMRDAG